MQKILIVDDDRTLTAAITRYLEERGFVVNTAASGLAGFKSFSQELPDLIVSDVVMPGIDGFELCTKVRDTDVGQLLPFIFLSVRCGLEDRVQGHTLGADDYLVKPFHPKELIAKIEAQLARASRIRFHINLAVQEAQPQPASERPPLPLTPAEKKCFGRLFKGIPTRK